MNGGDVTSVTKECDVDYLLRCQESGDNDSKQPFPILKLPQQSKTILMAFKAWVSIVLGFVLVSSIFYFAYTWSVANATCDDAPYIYATYHDLVPNVVKYSRNGCLLSSTVLIGGPKHTAPNHTIEMRSRVFGKYKETPLQ